MKSPFLGISDDIYGAALHLSGHLARQGFNLEAVHQYATVEGVPLWWVLRWKNPVTREKRPLPMSRTESGWFVLKRPDFGRCGAPLYRAHVLANYPGERIYLVEGEWCVETLEALGGIATTWPNGAAGVERADWSPLAGSNVVAWPDNDAPGFESMDKARRILRGLDARVVVLDVEAMGLPPKGDVADWLRLFVERHGARSLHEIPDGHALAWAEIEALPVKEWKVAA